MDDTRAKADSMGGDYGADILTGSNSPSRQRGWEPKEGRKKGQNQLGNGVGERKKKKSRGTQASTLKRTVEGGAPPSACTSEHRRKLGNRCQQG